MCGRKTTCHSFFQVSKVLKNDRLAEQPEGVDFVLLSPPDPIHVLTGNLGRDTVPGEWVIRQFDILTKINSAGQTVR